MFEATTWEDLHATTYGTRQTFPQSKSNDAIHVLRNLTNFLTPIAVHNESALPNTAAIEAISGCTDSEWHHKAFGL